VFYREVIMRAWIAAGLLVALAGCADNPQSHGYALMSNKLEEMDELTLYREDLADGKLTYCGFAQADKTLTEAVRIEAEPLRAELASGSR